MKSDRGMREIRLGKTERGDRGEREGEGEGKGGRDGRRETESIM